MFVVSALCAQTPRNIIVMIADGCGFEHVRALNYYEFGRDSLLVFQSFPVQLAVSTYSMDTAAAYDPVAIRREADAVLDDPTDSAASGTTLSTGVKTWNHYIGLDAWRRPLQHLSERGYEQSKAVGLVTTMVFGHATPATFAVHNANRRDYLGIARQLLTESNVRVLMGCGNPAVLAADSTDYKPRDFRYAGGRETWESVLASTPMADCDNDGIGDSWEVVFSREAFLALADGDTPVRVLGVPMAGKTTQQQREGDPEADAFAVPFTQGVPSLAEMTNAALNVLDDDPDGFFLMVEGGAIDKASHKNWAGRTIEETRDFHQAVQAVLEWVETHGGWNETLVIVTADHECGGLVGPGSVCEDNDVRLFPVENRGAGNMPGMDWLTDHHTNFLVPFYARGAGSERFGAHVIGNDPEHGPYIDNTSIGRTLHELWGGWNQPELKPGAAPHPDSFE